MELFFAQALGFGAGKKRRQSTPRRGDFALRGNLCEGDIRWDRGERPQERRQGRKGGQRGPPGTAALGRPGARAARQFPEGKAWDSSGPGAAREQEGRWLPAGGGAVPARRACRTEKTRV